MAAAAESPSPGDTLAPSDQLDCCSASGCVHQLHRLVYCYYGFRPFLDNAQVQLGDVTARPAAEEGRCRSGQSRRRPGRGSRGRSCSERSSTPTSTGRSSRQPQGRAATPTGPTQAESSQGCGRGGEKDGKPAVRPVRRVRSGTPSRAASPAPPTGLAPMTAPPARPAPPALLPTPPPAAKLPASALSRSAQSEVTRPQTPRTGQDPSSTSSSSLHTPPPPPPELGRHLAAMFSRLSFLATPPGALPAFVHVPPPCSDAAFHGSRSHGSLETELDRCRSPPPAARRRHRSGGAAPAREAPPCCPGGGGHRDSYDPRLDVPPAGEERSGEQVRSERLLMNFNMFRDWDYVPFHCEPPDLRITPERRRRAGSVCSSSDSDGDGSPRPRVTICSRVGGVFHYIPAQRLLKSAAPARGRDGGEADG